MRPRSAGHRDGAEIFWNLDTAPLVEQAVRRGEGLLAKDGPLVVETGKHTGRSAKDKFTVQDAADRRTSSGGARQQADDAGSVRPAQGRFLLALADKEQLYVADLYGGSQPEHRVQRARDQRARLAQPVHPHPAGAARKRRNWPASRPNSRSSTCRASAPIPSATAAAARPSSRSTSPKKLILIGGTAYAGEMKKSVFGLLNYLLPPKGVMPMHCSANIGPDGDTRSSSACRAPARRRCRPTPAAR